MFAIVQPMRRQIGPHIYTPPGLIGRWMPNGRAENQRGRFVDQSGNGHDGTMEHLGSLYADGPSSGDHLYSAAGIPGALPSTGFTMMGWVFNQGGTYFLSAGSPPAIKAVGSTAHFYFVDSTGSHIFAASGSGLLTADTWRHLTVKFTVSGSNVNVRFYKNGVYHSQQNYTDGVSAAWDAVVRLFFAFTVVTATSRLKGRMRCWTFFSAPLEDADIKRFYDFPLAAKADPTYTDMVTFREGAGATITSEKGVAFSITGAVHTRSEDGGQTFTERDGTAGDCFRGSMEFHAALEPAIKLNIAATVNALEACTAITWIEHVEVGANNRFFAASDASDAASDWSIGSLSADGKGDAICREAGGVIMQVRSPDVLTLDGSRMHCLALASDSTGNTFMVDGAVAADYMTGNAATPATPSLVADIDNVLIGARRDSGGIEYPMQGSWYRTDLYNRRLSAAELQTLTARGPWR